MDNNTFDELIREIRECRKNLEDTRDICNSMSRDIQCALERVEYIREKLDRVKVGVFS